MAKQQTASSVEQIVADALAAIGVEDQDCAEKLLSVGYLFATWNQSKSLFSQNEVHDIVSAHIVDSIYAHAKLPQAETILDLGSGVGLPGLPLAILRPDSKIVCIDSQRSKALLVEEAARRLELVNLRSIADRISSIAPADIGLTDKGILVSRAFSPLERLLDESAALMSAGWRLSYLTGNASKVYDLVERSELFHAFDEIAYHPDHPDKRILTIAPY